MTQPAQTVTPRLGPALLREIPRFFGGFPATLQELLQNSLRAQATEVHFDLDGQVLTVTDNGLGLDDPQVLLTAAESGWDSGVVEPAGLGALSALNPEFAALVTYRSRNWEFSLTPEAFALGQSVPVEAAEPISGFQVILHLTLWPDLAYLLEQRRGYAPITVRANGKVLAPKRPRGERLDTPAGALYVEPESYGRNFRAVWEHFPVHADMLRHRIMQVGTPTVAALIQNRDFTLLIDPESGLRPKLPDRNALLDDRALHLAAQGIAARLDVYVTGQLRAAFPGLGAEVIHETTLKSAWHLFGREVVSAFLKAEGYVSTTLSHPATVEAYLSDDGDDDTSGGWTEDWVKPTLGVAFAPETSEQSTLTLLRAQGYAVPYGTPDTDPHHALQVEAEGLRTFRMLTDYSIRVMLGLAETLRVNGVDVPVYVQVDPEDEIDSEDVVRRGPYALVLGGTPEAAETYLRANQEALGGLLLLALLDTADLRESELGEWDCTLSARDLGEGILHDFIQAFFPDRAQAQVTVARLREAAQHLRVGIQALNGATRCLPDGEDFSACLAQVQRTHDRTEEQIQALVAQHRLQ